MKLTELRVRNYKSFREEQGVTFGPDCTVIVGQNNVGKTALLECLQLTQVPGHFHRSIISLPRSNSILVDPLVVSLTSELEQDEFRQLFTSGVSLLPRIPANVQPSERAQLVSAFLKAERVKIRMERELKPGEGPAFRAHLTASSGQNFQIEHGALLHAYRADIRGGADPKIEDTGSAQSGPWPQPISEWIDSHIYRFVAERLRLTQGPSGHGTLLATDASNLPGVLNHLSSANRYRYARYVECVREVLPTVADVSAIHIGRENVEIRVSSLEGARQRPDLTQSLSECGSGVGQVLAIL